jgi:ligand-binding SRPBCC domain-containing protein
LKQNWVSVITRSDQTKVMWSFRDEGKILPWPLKSWRHDHIVRKLSETHSEIIDDITFDAGSFNYIIYPLLKATFGIRPKRYKRYFED